MEIQGFFSFHAHHSHRSSLSASQFRGAPNIYIGIFFCDKGKMSHLMKIKFEFFPCNDFEKKFLAYLKNISKSLQKSSRKDEYEVNLWTNQTSAQIMENFQVWFAFPSLRNFTPSIGKIAYSFISLREKHEMWKMKERESH